ncbi:MAG: SpoIIE family protein phosphatase [Bacteroidia bacterium]|nr:SpoIIE family protein phosphatase [Bacteroidia bacterium]
MKKSQFLEKKLIIQEDFGEGLIGQSFLENETIHISQVPDQYVNIVSGLGNAKPRSILIVPLELNNRIEGIIEIASLREFEQHEVEFVEKLAENIASAILTIKVNEHTKKLLRESQELAEKLRAQEEEIRQNYEELQATQEIVEKKNRLIEQQKHEIEKALKEQTEKSEMLEAQEEEMRQNMEELVTTQEQMIITQAELDGQLNAINNSRIGKVEYSLDGKIINANSSFCQLLRYNLESLQGKDHIILAKSNWAEAQEYEAFWSKLRHGEAQAGEYRLRNRDGEDVWVNAVYSPVVDQNTQAYKIIQLAFDITEAKQLLKETQNQAHILQVQEEELRQNMEELKVTQEELNRKSQAIIELKEEEAKKARLKAREIESKNQLITASIQYAQNIQRAILPSEERIKQYVQDLFVVYLPKDIVSGDFYWFSHIDGKTFIAAVDCTGHGVPGAFMSIIGNTLLNEIVNVQKIFDPNIILEMLHQGVRTKLRQDESSNYDGMDLVMCRLEYDLPQVKICFSGAKRPLYYLRQQGMDELRGDRKSIGGWQKEVHRTFEQQEIVLSQGDYLYLTTDGLVDNPNGRRKKFGVKRFKQIVCDNVSLPLNQVKLALLDALIDHQQGAEQRDDITVLGIKL